MEILIFPSNMHKSNQMMRMDRKQIYPAIFKSKAARKILKSISIREVQILNIWFFLFLPLVVNASTLKIVGIDTSLFLIFQEINLATSIAIPPPIPTIVSKSGKSLI